MTSEIQQVGSLSPIFGNLDEVYLVSFLANLTYIKRIKGTVVHSVFSIQVLIIYFCCIAASFY